MTASTDSRVRMMWVYLLAALLCRVPPHAVRDGCVTPQGAYIQGRGSPPREDSPPYFRALQGKNSNLRNHHLFR